MAIKITDYNVICNLGNDINEVFNNAINGDDSRFEIKNDIIKNKKIRIGSINRNLPEISDKKYDTRCNRILLKCLEKIDIESKIKKYGREKIGVIIATTNTGTPEFEYTKDLRHGEIGNPAEFIKKYFDLKNYYASISTACSSGIKAFSTAVELLNSDICDCVIVGGADSISKVPVFGFHSLEILTEEKSNPFSKNRKGMNIAEGCGVFVLEKDVEKGINILSTSESTDFYHLTSSDPSAKEAVNTVKSALKKASVMPNEIDYINLHGTGTQSNDMSEARATAEIFGNITPPASSTKPLTGHCLGAAASVETGLCCKLLETKSKIVFPHVFDGVYDDNIEKINLAGKNELQKVPKTILCTSFGFGGTNAAIILGADE